MKDFFLKQQCTKYVLLIGLINILKHRGSFYERWIQNRGKEIFSLKAFVVLERARRTKKTPVSSWENEEQTVLQS